MDWSSLGSYTIQRQEEWGKVKLQNASGVRWFGSEGGMHNGRAISVYPRSNCHFRAECAFMCHTPLLLCPSALEP
jgi:hypothetical protein